MSKEYIEREAAVAFLENMAASRYLIQCFESKEKFPAADVVEVRHGEWKMRISPVCLSGDFYYNCSVCGERDPWQRTTRGHANYCPNCGAKMDGGKEQ